MFSIICSSRSTRHETKHCGKDKPSAGAIGAGLVKFLPVLLGFGLAAFAFQATAQASAPSTAPATSAPQPFGPNGVFNSLEFATNAPAGTQQWLKVQARMQTEQGLYDKCDKGDESCPAYLATWRKNLKEWKSYSPEMQLELVNAYVNHQIKYTSDDVVFGVADYWASPAESLKGRGDCEDYAIAKYASLRALGYGDDQLRIVIVNDTRKMLGHAVLSVKTADGQTILDNQNALPRRDTDLAYYAPLYSLNAHGHWLNIATKRIETLPAAEVATAAGHATGRHHEALALRGSLINDAAFDDITPAASPFSVASLHSLEDRR